MVEIVNAVGSILNYQGRKADDGANMTSEDQKGVDARKEVRLIPFILKYQWHMSLSLCIILASDIFLPCQRPF